MALILKLDRLTCGYRGVPIIEDISFEVLPGDIVCVLGANGIGKTTFYRTMMNIIPPISGSIKLNKTDICSMSRTKLAKHIAYVPQSTTPAFPYSVLDLVTMGRTAHLSVFASPSRKEEAVAMDALERLGIAQLAFCPFSEISGGERRLVLIARALTQNTDILFMDEPTASLDFGREMQILNCIRSLASKERSVVYSTHSPTHAFICATKVIALMGGNHFVAGLVEDVLNEMLLKQIYGIDVGLRDVPTMQGSYKVCVPLNN